MLKIVLLCSLLAVAYAGLNVQTLCKGPGGVKCADPLFGCSGYQFLGVTTGNLPGCGVKRVRQARPVVGVGKVDGLEGVLEGADGPIHCPEGQSK
jgi:hypothetical protein